MVLGGLKHFFRELKAGCGGFVNDFFSWFTRRYVYDGTGGELLALNVLMITRFLLLILVLTFLSLFVHAAIKRVGWV